MNILVPVKRVIDLKVGHGNIVAPQLCGAI